MRNYSPFFSTVYDEPGPIGPIGRGTHYSVLRSILWKSTTPHFHDFAVIWDEDHDVRVIYVAEKMCAAGLLGPALAIGERKGSVTVLTATPQPQTYSESVGDISESLPSDSFPCDVELFDEASPLIIHDAPARIRAYLSGVRSLWNLGTKPCVFSEAAFHRTLSTSAAGF